MSDNSDMDQDDRNPMTATLLVVAVHAALLAVLLIILHCVIPVFWQMFKDFGKALPVPTRVAYDIGNTSLLTLTITAICLLVVDGIVYFCAVNTPIPGLARSWAWFVSCLLGVLIALSVVASFLPMFKMTQMVGGGP